MHAAMWLSERDQTQKNAFSRSQSPWPSDQAKPMYFERAQNGAGPQVGRKETPRQLSDSMQSPLRGQGSRLHRHTHCQDKTNGQGTVTGRPWWSSG